MHAEIRKASLSEEIKTEERCYILEVANDFGDEFVSISRARVEIGTTTALHYLKGITERYVIISGKGRVELAGLEPIDVVEDDVVRIPAGTAQRITNIGIDNLIFYCICSPPFSPICYQSLE